MNPETIGPTPQPLINNPSESPPTSGTSGSEAPKANQQSEIPQSSTNEPKKRVNFKTVTAKVVGIISFLVGFAIVGILIHHGSNSPSNPTALTTDTSWRVYTSTAYNFNVEFPGNPTASNSSLTVQGIAVPYTSYERDNNSSYWAVNVFNYPSQFNMSDVKARLEGALNGSVENTKGATLTSSSYATMAGYTAITGLISVPSGGSSVNEYITGFLKRNQMFYFIGTGATQSDFSHFTDSFHFTQ